jgi:hypothetical protein
MRDKPHIGGLPALFLIGAAVRDGTGVAHVLLRIEHAGAGLADAVEVAAHARLRSTEPHAHVEVWRDGAHPLGRLLGKVDAWDEDDGRAIIARLADGARPDPDRRGRNRERRGAFLEL